MCVGGGGMSKSVRLHEKQNLKSLSRAHSLGVYIAMCVCARTISQNAEMLAA